MEDATSRITGKHPFFWFVLGYTVLFAALLIFVCGVTYRFGTAQRERGWDCSFQSNRCYARVDPKGPAAGKLKSGDLILAVNGNTAFSAYTIHDQKNSDDSRGRRLQAFYFTKFNENGFGSGVIGNNKY